MTSPVLTRERVILAKLESSYGNDSTPGVGDVIPCREPDITPLEGDNIDRTAAQAFPGRSTATPDFMTNMRTMVTIPVELAGGGLTGTNVNVPKYDVLLQCCQFNLTDTGSSPITARTYTPSDLEAQKSCTIYINVGNVIQKVTGCRGNAALSFDQNQIPLITFTMTGRFAAPDYQAIQAGNLSPGGKVTAYSRDHTVVTMGRLTDGLQGTCVGNISLDLANQMVFRDLPGCDQSLVTNRLVSGSIEVEPSNTDNTDNQSWLDTWFNRQTTEEFSSLKVVQGSGDGNEITLDVPRIKLMQPSWTDKDGVQFVSIPFDVYPSTAGNDELSIAYT